MSFSVAHFLIKQVYLLCNCTIRCQNNGRMLNYNIIVVAVVAIKQLSYYLDAYLLFLK